MDAIEPAPRSRSGRTNCRKDQQPYRLQAAKNQASWYCSSWRGLQSDASTPDDSRLITPETTPPSIPTNSKTAPLQARNWKPIRRPVAIEFVRNDQRGRRNFQALRSPDCMTHQCATVDSPGKRVRQHNQSGPRYIEFTATFAVNSEHVRLPRIIFCDACSFTNWAVGHLYHRSRWARPRPVSIKAHPATAGNPPLTALCPHRQSFGPTA